MSSTITPYQIAVPQAKLDRLHQKLALADFPDELEGAAWDYGCPLDDIKRLVHHWHAVFDWRKAEAELNRMPQFTIDITPDGFETLKIHFVHKRSEVKGAIPLLFAHGWPGSFDEVRKILPELIRGGKEYPAFHVVAPSLANFGFSEGTKKVRRLHNPKRRVGAETYRWSAGLPTENMPRSAISSCKHSDMMNMVRSTSATPAIITNLTLASHSSW